MVLQQLLHKARAGAARPLNALVNRLRKTALAEALAEARKTRDLMARFHEEQDKRRRQYQGRDFRFQDHQEVVNALHRDGYVVVRGVGDREALAEVKRELEREIDAGTNLYASDDTLRTPGDLAGPPGFMSLEERLRGQDYLRRHTNFATVTDPLVTCPSIVKFAFDDRVIDVASAYLECLAGVGTLNLRKSYVNDLADFDTLYFHSDKNSPRFLKFFYYLNDVDEHGGPFCYVRGSHRKRFRGWLRKHRWTNDEIEAVYGKDQIVYLTANVGDLIVADTTGFHRGTKVRSRDRSMLTINYVLHPEDWGRVRYKIAARDHERLAPKQKAAADFLDVVGEPSRLEEVPSLS